MLASTLSELFKANGVRERCDLCGCEDWVYYDPIKELVTNGLGQEGRLVSCSIPVLMIYCENCGQIKMLAKKVWEAKEASDANVP